MLRVRNSGHGRPQCRIQSQQVGLFNDSADNVQDFANIANLFRQLLDLTRGYPQAR